MPSWQRLAVLGGVILATAVVAEIVDRRMARRALPPEAVTRYRILRRAVVSTIVFVGVLSALLVIPQVRAVAGGLLASSAVVGLVVGGVGAAVWIVVFLVFRYASLASILAALSLPLASVLLDESWPVIVFASAAAVGVVLLHRANIARLRSGTESRFKFRGLTPKASDPNSSATRRATP